MTSDIEPTPQDQTPTKKHVAKKPTATKKKTKKKKAVRKKKMKKTVKKPKPRKLASGLPRFRPKPTRKDKFGNRIDETGLEYFDTHQESKLKRRSTRTPERRRIINTRVEEIRALLSLSMTPFDILRTLSPKWGIGFEAVRKYYKIARKRQLNHLDRTGPEAKADSLQYWTRRMLEAQNAKQKAAADLENAKQLVDNAKEMLRSLNSSLPENSEEGTKQLEELSTTLNMAKELRESSKRAITYWSAEADAIQDRIDKLCGNYSPERIAYVNTQGEDIVDKPEPLTREQAKQGLMDLLTDLSKELGQPEPKPDLLEVEAIPIRTVESD